jgi:hypothetical protein
MSIAICPLDWSGTRKSRLLELLHRTSRDGGYMFCWVMCLRFAVSILYITLHGSEAGLGLAVCSFATELFVHRPSTHGTALSQLVVHGWIASWLSRYKLSCPLFSCMAALSLGCLFLGFIQWVMTLSRIAVRLYGSIEPLRYPVLTAHFCEHLFGLPNGFQISALPCFFGLI